MPAHRTKDGHLRVALAVLDEFGPQGSPLPFSAQDLAGAVGVHRSTLYRHWATAVDLHDDLAAWGAIERIGWQRRLVAQDPAQDIEVAVLEALEHVTDELAIGMRAALVGFPQRRSSRAVAAWEQAWLLDLAWWIVRHLGERGRRPRGAVSGLDLAIAVACVIEGQLTLGSLLGGPQLDGWKPDHSDLIAMSASQVLEQMTEFGPARVHHAAPRPVLPTIVGWSVAKRSLASRVSDALHAAPFDAAGWSEPARLVDIALLSRRIGVTTRRLYSVWPAPADLNADLVELVIIRHQERGEVNANEALAEGLRQPGVEAEQVLAHMAEAIVIGGATTRHVSPFGCLAAMTHPLPRHRGAALVEGSMQRQQVAVLAMLQTFGYDIRPSLDVDQFIRVLYGVITGAQRLALTHPYLKRRTILRADGSRVLSLAVPLGQAILACTVPR